VLVHHDSSAAPQTVQSASPVCGTKNFVSVRLYSAPQLHRTIVAIPGICAYREPDQAGSRALFKGTPLPEPLATRATYGAAPAPRRRDGC
jgi:hypothetical protein